MDSHDKYHAWRKVIRSFSYAGQGIRQTWRSELNFRIEIAISILVIGMASFFGLALSEWAILCLTISIVLALELVNTALEAVVDLITDHRYAPLAKVAKDASAGAVFLASIMAVIIGGLIFIPYLWEWGRNWGTL